MTPLEIRALLSVYCRPSDRLHHLAVESLMNCELIRPAAGPQNFASCPLPGSRVARTLGLEPAQDLGLLAGDYELTNRGKAMVNAFMNLPLPTLEERWTIGPTDCTEPL